MAPVAKKEVTGRSSLPLFVCPLPSPGATWRSESRLLGAAAGDKRNGVAIESQVQKGGGRRSGGIEERGEKTLISSVVAVAPFVIGGLAVPPLAHLSFLGSQFSFMARRCKEVSWVIGERLKCRFF